MGAYTLNVSAGVTGAGQLDATAASMDKLTARTKAVDEAIRQYAGSNDKLLASHLKLQQTETQLEVLREKHRMQQESLAAATVKGAAAQETFNTATIRGSSSVRDMTNSLRMMEGAMPIRAAARLLSSIQGIGAITGTLFAVTGAVAMLGFLDTVAGKLGIHFNLWSDVTKAEKQAVESIKTYGEQAAASLQKVIEIQKEIFAATHTPLEIAQYTEDAARQAAIKAQNRQAELIRQQSAVQRWMAPGGTQMSAADQALVGTAVGLGPDQVANANLSQRRLAAAFLKQAPAEIHAASETSNEQQHQLELAQIRTKQEVDQIATNKQTQDKKTADDAAKQRQREIAEAEKQAAAYLREAQTFELSGLAKINEAYRQKLDLIGKTKQAISDLTAAHGIEVQRELQRIAAQPVALAATDHPELNALIALFASTGHFTQTNMAPAQRQIDAMQRMLQRSDSADIARVQRNAQPTGNPAQDYQARITAANEVLRIEMQRIDVAKLDAAVQDMIAGKQINLTQEELQDEQRLAEVRAKNAEELYNAEQDYRKQLANAREQDLAKYHQMAEGLFTAVKTHSTTQWGKTFVTGQEQQLFANIAQAPLQQIGHMMGGLTGGSSLGGILTGTVFDPAARGVDVAKTTAANTGNTVTQLMGLRSDLKGIFTGNPDALSPVSPSGAGAFNPFATLPISNTSGVSMMQALGLGSPVAYGSAPGPVSGLPGFMGGMGIGGSNLIQAAFTGTANGPGWGTTLSTAQQVGAGVGLGTAIAAGTYAAVSEFGKGGASGALGGVASLAAMASLIPGAGIATAPIAAVTGLLSSLFSTGPQQRQQQITDYLAKNAYLAPTALNVMQGMNGTYESFDARGNLMTSNMSAVPTVTEPYITKRTIAGQQGWYDAPGQVTAPYSGGATGTGVTPVSNAQIVINVAGNLHAMDSESFHRFVTKTANAAAVGDAAVIHLQAGGERLASMIRYHANG